MESILRAFGIPKWQKAVVAGGEGGWREELRLAWKALASPPGAAGDIPRSRQGGPGVLPGAGRGCLCLTTGGVVLPTAQHLPKLLPGAAEGWRGATQMWDVLLGTRWRYRGAPQLPQTSLAVLEGCPSAAVTVTACLGASNVAVL